MSVTWRRRLGGGAFALFLGALLWAIWLTVDPGHPSASYAVFYGLAGLSLLVLLLVAWLGRSDAEDDPAVRKRRARAQRLAEDHARSLADAPPRQRDDSIVWPIFVLALAAVQTPGDIVDAPFRPSFLEALRRSAERRFPDAECAGRASLQTCSWVSLNEPKGGDWPEATWFAVAHRDGTVAIGHGEDPATWGPEEKNFRAAWGLAAELLNELGCRGEACLCILVKGCAWLDRVEVPAPVKLDTEAREPRAEEFQRAWTELLRANGAEGLAPERKVSAQKRFSVRSLWPRHRHEPEK